MKLVLLYLLLLLYSLLFIIFFILFLKPYVSRESFCENKNRTGAWTYNWLNDPKIVNQFKIKQNCDCLLRYFD
jgi:hypothetical protein